MIYTCPRENVVQEQEISYKISLIAGALSTEELIRIKYMLGSHADTVAYSDRRTSERRQRAGKQAPCIAR